MMKGTYKFFALLLCMSILVAVFTACSGKGGGKSDDPSAGLYSDAYVNRTTNKVEKDYGVHPQVKFTVQVEGEDPFDFVIQLYPDLAPATCENFMKLVDSGFYNGLTFHRIVRGLMIQGGDPLGNGTGGVDNIPGEFADNGFDNKISHTRGVVSMWHKEGAKNSSNCQFFICYSDILKDDLDGHYAAFGKVIDGMLALDALDEKPKEADSNGQITKPAKDIIIKSAKLYNVTEGESAYFL